MTDEDKIIKQAAEVVNKFWRAGNNEDEELYDAVIELSNILATSHPKLLETLRDHDLVVTWECQRFVTVQARTLKEAKETAIAKMKDELGTEDHPRILKCGPVDFKGVAWRAKRL